MFHENKEVQGRSLVTLRLAIAAYSVFIEIVSISFDCLLELAASTITPTKIANKKLHHYLLSHYAIKHSLCFLILFQYNHDLVGTLPLS